MFKKKKDYWQEELAKVWRRLSFLEDENKNLYKKISQIECENPPIDRKLNEVEVLDYWHGTNVNAYEEVCGICGKLIKNALDESEKGEWEKNNNRMIRDYYIEMARKYDKLSEYP